MTDQSMRWCAYYRAIIKKEECWFLTATLRSFEHLCFDRTYDKSISQFEFFVPQELEHFFVQSEPALITITDKFTISDAIYYQQHRAFCAAVIRWGVSHAELAFLKKPFTPDVPARKVRERLDRP